MRKSTNEFVLTTRWVVAAPIDSVWRVLHDVQAWPSWWRYVRAVRVLQRGDADGVGARRRFVWATRLPYDIAFDMRTTRVERPRLLEGEASGDLNGSGRWQLRRARGGTLLRYEWRVRADKAWMRWLAPLLRPVFVWNHNAVMRAGEAGLRRLLAAPATIRSSPRRAGRMTTRVART
jgi:uncharacterized protein YndB with AHSA1/START domain